MLRLRTEFGVYVRNREQVEADRFGLLGREGPVSGERQRARARRMLERWRRDAKESGAGGSDAGVEMSIRERMSLKNILN